MRTRRTSRPFVALPITSRIASPRARPTPAQTPPRSSPALRNRRRYYVSIRKPAQSGLSFVWIYGRTLAKQDFPFSGTIREGEWDRALLRHVRRSQRAAAPSDHGPRGAHDPLG